MDTPIGRSEKIRTSGRGGINAALAAMRPYYNFKRPEVNLKYKKKNTRAHYLYSGIWSE